MRITVLAALVIPLFLVLMVPVAPPAVAVIPSAPVGGCPPSQGYVLIGLPVYVGSLDNPRTKILDAGNVTANAARADVNGDGYVCLQQFILGPGAPICLPWAFCSVVSFVDNNVPCFLGSARAVVGCKFSLITSSTLGGDVSPICPTYGSCLKSPGALVSVFETPSVGIFVRWVTTGTSCINGPYSNPCTFLMPINDVNVTADFLIGVIIPP